MAGIEEKVVTTTCASHCGGTCILNVHVKNGVVTRIESDLGKEPQMRACARGRAYRQRIYAPDRLTYPLKRVGPRGRGEFKRITWDEALDTVASELKRVSTNYGSASIILSASGGDVGQLHTRRQIHKLLCLAGGYSRSWASRSFEGAVAAVSATYGTHFANSSRDDLANSRLIIMWGWNPTSTRTGTNTCWFLALARESGTRIIAVDPRLTDSAAVFAHQWIPIRPGTDAAMLISMAYVIIADNLQDQAFLDKFTLGFDNFRSYVLGKEDGIPKTPAWAEPITGVSAPTIERLAREYAKTKPAALLAGIAPGRTAYGEQYHRVAMTLAAMTGNIGISGGDAAARSWASISWYPYKMKPGLFRIDEVPNPVETAGGLETKSGVVYTSPWSHRLGVSGGVSFASTWLHCDQIADCILWGTQGGYPVDPKLLYVVNSNFANQASNTNKIIKAFDKLEFIVVQEQFMTPTARFADIVLPTTTFLERNDIARGVGLPFYGYVNKVVDPVGECKNHLEICRELAKRLGINDFGDDTEDELLRKEVANTEVPDYDQFKTAGIYNLKLNEPYVALKKQIEDPANNPFPTPSGKIEIYSKQWESKKDPLLPPIPKYIETWESPNDPLARNYPLQLITTHFKRRALSQFDNTPWLRELQAQELLISTADAETRGIKNGDLVKVFNDRGKIIIRANVSERIMPGVLDLPMGAWFQPDDAGMDWGGCANVLTKDCPSPAGACSYNTCLVQVERVKED